VGFSAHGARNRKEAPLLAGWRAAKSSTTPPLSSAKSVLTASRATRRRCILSEHQRETKEEIAQTLWELEAGADCPAPGSMLSSLSAEEMAHVDSMVSDLGKPPDGMTPLGAFAELQGEEDYAGVRCDVAALRLDAVSLPSSSFKARSLKELMGDAGDVLEQRLLDEILPEELSKAKLASSSLKRPYSDPALRNTKVRADLVKLLLSSGIVEFTLNDGVRVGIFCVWKSGKERMRLIVDARLSNQHFREPGNVDLPTGASFSRFFTETYDDVHVSSCDLKDAFYTIQLRESLRHFFTLDPIKAKHLGI